MQASKFITAELHGIYSDVGAMHENLFLTKILPPPVAEAQAFALY